MSDKHRNRRGVEERGGGPPNSRVVHIRKDSYDIYIGRDKDGGMHYGNPFSYNPSWGIECQDREESVLRYKLWLEGTLLPHVEPQRREWILDNLEQLRGKTLGCFCAPLACHGNILLNMLNNKESK